MLQGKILKATEYAQSSTTDTNNSGLKADNHSQMTMYKYNFLLQMFTYNSLLEDREQYKNMAVCMDKLPYFYIAPCPPTESNIKIWQFAWTNIILLIVITTASLGIFSVVAFSPSRRSFALLSNIQDRWN